MKSLWDETNSLSSDIDLRVYSSNLLGQNENLVLHGGGNTSVKIDNILYVKGSGWDLSTIKKEGFSPVKIDKLLNLLKYETLSDKEMVKAQKEAMTDKKAPNPSVEAILHALIPFKFVDHTHADAVVTISNSKFGKEYIEKLFPNFLIVPYTMPGFILAKRVHELSKNLNWKKCGGIILHNHGIFTFSDNARESYEKMINSVTKAEEFLDTNAQISFSNNFTNSINFNINELLENISKGKGHEVFYNIDTSDLAKEYTSKKNLKTFATRGVLTPEHIIKTKRAPLVLERDDNITEEIEKYILEYKKYFQTYEKDETMINPYPNYAVIQDFGVISFAKTKKEAQVISDIVRHTMLAVLRADKLGGFQSISLKDSFEMEYWELEQAKLK